MTYRKVSAVMRCCAFCGTEFMAAHRRRLYCSNSCNTRACLARKASRLGSPPRKGSVRSANAPVKVTLASNWQNWTMLTAAPQVPKLVGAVLEFLGELLTPTSAGPTKWLPASLREAKGPLVAMQDASWDEPRFFTELQYAGHTIYYRAQHDLLVLREPTGSLRQLSTAAEFAALAPKPRLSPGLAALIEQHVPEFMAPAQAAPAAPLLPSLLPSQARQNEAE